MVQKQSRKALIIFLEYFDYQRWLSWSREHLWGEASLYGWPPVWPVGNVCPCSTKIQCTQHKRTFPNQSNRRSAVQWYFPFRVTLYSKCS